jgi:cytoskeletal protein CcmA (bactofilin family)
MNPRTRDEPVQPAGEANTQVEASTLALRLDVWCPGEEPGGSFPVDSATRVAPPRHDALDATRIPRSSGPGSVRRIVLEDPLVVPAGTILRGRVCARALLLAGEFIGDVHCGAGPVVICEGASLKGQLIAGGDVHVCGSVVDYAGGTVIITPGRLVLAPGARVEGDVRSGRLEVHEGAVLKGAARGFDR